MAVMGVWALILCTRRRWHIKQKNKKTWKHTKPIFPEQKTKKSFTLHYRFDWNLESINIWTNCQFIWSGKVYIWLSVWEFKKLCLWQPCLNKLMHVDRELKYWSPSTLLLCGHFIQIHSCMSICFSCMYTNNYKHFHKWYFFTLIIQC